MPMEAMGIDISCVKEETQAQATSCDGTSYSIAVLTRLWGAQLSLWCMRHRHQQ